MPGKTDVDETITRTTKSTTNAEVHLSSPEDSRTASADTQAVKGRQRKMWTWWRTNCGDVVTKDMEKVKGLEDSSTLAFAGTVSSWLHCAKQWGLVPQSITHVVEDRAGDH